MASLENKNPDIALYALKIIMLFFRTPPRCLDAQISNIVAILLRISSSVHSQLRKTVLDCFSVLLNLDNDMQVVSVMKQGVGRLTDFFGRSMTDSDNTVAEEAATAVSVLMQSEVYYKSPQFLPQIPTLVPRLMNLLKLDDVDLYPPVCDHVDMDGAPLLSVARQRSGSGGGGGGGGGEKYRHNAIRS